MSKRLKRATASYNILLVLLVGTGLVIVPPAAEAASSLLGIEPRSGGVVLSLLLAGVLVPAHRRLRPQIDRLFFKERFALDHGIAELLTAPKALRESCLIEADGGIETMVDNKIILRAVKLVN